MRSARATPTPPSPVKGEERKVRGGESARRLRLRPVEGAVYDPRVRAKSIPKKLKRDAIIEAVLQVQFETAIAPEVLYRKVLDAPVWTGFQPQRIPGADARQRHEPALELREESGARLARIGPQVFSFHRLAPYPGWTTFRPELLAGIEQLFRGGGGELTARRLGLRYVNALSAAHGVGGPADLDVALTVDSEAVTANLSLTFTRDVFVGAACTVRLATNEFVEGGVPEGTTIVDLDVFTKDRQSIKTVAAVHGWIDAAHDAAKTAFFALLPTRIIDALKDG